MNTRGARLPRPELALFKDKIQSWGIVDQFGASSNLQQRKPEMGAYSAFLCKIQESALNCIFIDDKVGSVVNAQGLGFKGIVFSTTDELIRGLHNLLGDPVTCDRIYLKKNAKNLFCTMNTGSLQPDNFSQLLIFHHTGDRDLVVLKNEGDTWNYFHGSPTYDGTTYPDDPDTTSLALTMLEDISMEQKLKARDVILSYVNDDGLPQVSANTVNFFFSILMIYKAWFNKNLPRFCHCICANVFRFFAINDWTDKLPGVYEYLCRVLETRAFLHGSRYYKIPDWFTYILSDLCARRPSDEKLQRMRDLLVECVEERMGCDDNILGAAMRALSAQSLGLKNDRHLRILLESQQLDGGWELVWLWSCATKPLKIGSRGVVTAMAMDAIQRALI
ncbi:hypothetical protein FAGAP_4370 [Fusarium agapanthi]|uniref:Uncharacterized protein n=1 Tax=Fusarium agapanthi TaxID=1803897 RepID=A0A9P5BCD7_9HYPO|nr:hypothetical protein FAGAP_4370 [Fusarium agapanthi]